MATVQDANLNLSFNAEGEEPVPGLLKMQHNNGNVSLAFYPEIPADPQTGRKARIAQIPDHVYQLSDFTMIEMSPDNRIQVKLSGSRANCTLNFTNDRDTSKLFDYIEQKVHLTRSDCNPSISLFESLDSSVESASPTMTTHLPQPKEFQIKMPTSLSLDSLKKPGVDFVVRNPPTHISKEEYEALFDEEGRVKEPETFTSKFYNVDLDPSIAGDLWQILLFRTSKVDEKPEGRDDTEGLKMTREQREEQYRENRKIYSIVKKQWRSITKRQWDNFPDLQQIVQTIEGDLHLYETELFGKYPHIEEAQKMAFNILLTVTYYNWDGAAYKRDMITFLMPFLDSFLVDVEGETAKRTDGRECPTEELEGDIFWCFYQFYTQNQLSSLIHTSQEKNLKTLFTAIGGILESPFGELLQLLTMKHANSLDFLRNDCASWFTTVFKGDEIRRLWLSVLASNGWFRFFQCFIVALLFSMSQKLVEMNPLNSSEFVKRFNEKKNDISLDLLLENTKGVMNLTQPQQSQ